jgi:sulfite dehydrogenase (quinone) subunit SoeC
LDRPVALRLIVHPSPSLIVFTTLTGAGYGLLFWLGLGAASGILPPDRAFAATSLALALVAVTGGLVSSVFHLGRPERAWRAFSQWRSSWLSREGVASVATFAPALLFAWGWVVRGSAHGVWGACAVLASAGGAATVVCTAHIYRSLTPIAHWNNGWVPANFLALAAMTGAAWLAVLCAAFDVAFPAATLVAIAATLCAAPLKLLYWRHVDRRPGASTAESATGLGALGRVRAFEAPHTEANYLLKEMGFAVARKHAAKLRRIGFQLAFVIPPLLLLIALAEGGWPRVAASFLAAPIATAGVLIERWLFFAEAKHTVTLYYGAARA